MVSVYELVFIKNFEVLFPLIYAIPSVILYVRILVLIVCNLQKDFKSSFYKLFILCGTVDILAWLSYYIALRTATAPCFWWLWEGIPSEGLVPGLILLFKNYLLDLEYFCNFLLTFNRFTSLIFPIKFRSWNNIVHFVVIIAILFPVPFVWQIPFNQPTAYINNASNIFDGFGLVQKADNQLGINLSQSTTIICVILSTIAMVMYGIMLHRIHTASHTSIAIKKAEIRLMLFALIMFILQLLYAVVQIMFYVNGILKASWSWPVLYPVQKYLLDLILLSPPWFLVLMSSDLRKALLKTFPFVMFLRKINVVNNNAWVLSSSNNR